MENKIIILLLIASLVGCTNHIESVNENNHVEQAKKDSTKTIVINNNAYYKLHFKGDTSYTIEWGNESITNETKRTFEVLGNGTLSLLKSNNSAIILRQGCGTSCAYYVVLPFNTGLSEKVFMQAIAYDISENVIAYIPDEEPFIRIENYLTGQKIDIIETNLCPAAFKGECIDTSYFKEDSFIIKWQGSKWDNNKLDPQMKIIPIKF